jgi:outer membrane immunogenic protein
MQDKTYNFVSPVGLGIVGSDRIRQDVDLVTARLNYRFGGPAISKY